MTNSKQFINWNNPHLNQSKLLITNQLLIKANRTIRQLKIYEAQPPALVKLTDNIFKKIFDLKRTVHRDSFAKYLNAYQHYQAKTASE